MPQILESSVPDLVLPTEKTNVDRDRVVTLDAIAQPSRFVVEWQISEPEPSETPHS